MLADLEDDMRDYKVGAYGGPGPARPGRHMPRLLSSLMSASRSVSIAWTAQRMVALAGAACIPCT
jgi:hypothetical protein